MPIFGNGKRWLDGIVKIETRIFLKNEDMEKIRKILLARTFALHDAV